MNRKSTDDNLISQIRDVKDVSTRDPRAAARGRARFLAEAAQLHEAAFQRKEKGRSGWTSLFQTRMPVLKAVIAALIVLFILASATTVLAAQNSLPNQPLYGVKILTEDAALRLTTDPSARLTRSMVLAERRVQEMSDLVERNETIPETVNQRLRLHIETALHLAAAQSDDRMHASLLRIQSELQIQEQKMTSLQGRAPESDRPVLEQARVMLRQQWKIAEQGIEDPPAFRNRYRGPRPTVSETPTPTQTGLPVPSATAAPTKSGNGYGGPNKGTPGPHSTPHPNSTPGSGGGGTGPNPSVTPGGGNNGGGGSGGGGGGGGGGGKP